MVVITSFPPPTEGIKHQQPSTIVFINKREVGKGTVYIAESRLSWMDDCTGKGFSIEYPHISIHAVSRDLQAFPEECLYVMLDSAIEEPEPVKEEDEDEEPLDMTEVRFIPDDKGKLDDMYNAMNQCQALHPDPQESFSEDEDSDDEFEDGENGMNGSKEMEMEVDGQFEDAECD